MVRSTLLSSTVGLVALLTNCTLSERETIPKVSTKISEAAYYMQVTSFANYDPPITFKFISLEERIRPHLFYGIDYKLDVVHKTRDICDFAELKILIYQQAKKLGLSKQQLRNYSPKKTIETICAIISDKVDYFARGSYEGKREEKLSALKKVFVDAQKSTSDQKEKTSLQQGVVLVGEVGDAYEKIDELKDNFFRRIFFGLTSLSETNLLIVQLQVEKIKEDLANLGAVATLHAGYDNLPATKLLQKETGIVCRQYTSIASDMFFVLKQENLNLRNTYVAEYSDKGHRWNQVITLSGDNKKIGVALSFFDPTFYDSLGKSHIDGFDAWHNSLLLRSQIVRLVMDLGIKAKKPILK